MTPSSGDAETNNHTHYAQFDKDRMEWVCADCGEVVERPGRNTRR